MAFSLVAVFACCTQHKGIRIDAAPIDTSQLGGSPSGVAGETGSSNAGGVIVGGSSGTGGAIETGVSSVQASSQGGTKSTAGSTGGSKSVGGSTGGATMNSGGTTSAGGGVNADAGTSAPAQDAACDAISLMKRIAAGAQGVKIPGGCEASSDGKDGTVVLDGAGKVTAITGVYYSDTTATQATVASLASESWPCLAGQTIRYRCANPVIGP
jgi:hypothetical protein